MRLLSHIENIYHHHFLGLLGFVFIQSGESIYDPPSLKFMSCEICNKAVELN